MRTGDEAQRKRIRHAPADARLLVEAGPGTGKTEMAAVRMAGLVRKGLAPGQLLVLSFSRSAVRNLTDRLARLEGTDDSIIEELRHVSIRTFDSWAFRMLRLLRNPLDALLARGHDDNIEKLTALFGGRRREEIRELISRDRRHLIVDEFQQSTDPATIRVLAWRLLPQVHRLSGQDCCVSAAEFVWKHSDQQPLPSARRRVRRRRPARMARICIGMAWMSSLS